LHVLYVVEWWNNCCYWQYSEHHFCCSC